MVIFTLSMVIFISSMVIFILSMVIDFTPFRTFVPEGDEVAAKRDVKRTAAATAGVAVYIICITGSGVCIVAGEFV
jgi:hypothetical protein